MPSRRVLPQRAPASVALPLLARGASTRARRPREARGAIAGLGGLSLTRRYVGRRKTATGEEGYFPRSHVEEQAPPPLKVLAAVGAGGAVAEEGAAAGDLGDS